MDAPFSPSRIWAVAVDGPDGHGLDADVVERLARILDLAPELPYIEVRAVTGSVRVRRRFAADNDDLVTRHLQGVFAAAPWISAISLPATSASPPRSACLADEPPPEGGLPALKWQWSGHDQDRSRLMRMMAALADSNEATLRSTSAEELLRRSCKAMTIGGLFTQTHVALLRPGSTALEVVSTAGEFRTTLSVARISIDPHVPEGSGLCGRAFRSRQPCISNDYLADPRFAHFQARMRRSGSRSSGAFPLMKQGEPIGVLQFFSKEIGAFTADMIELMSRMAANLSFALENFERIAAKDRADRALSYVSSHDLLTGLMNRGAFTRVLGEKIALARAGGAKLGLLAIDLDRFKSINDSLGHAEGDVLLVDIARRLSAPAPDERIVARLGGDEFVVLLPDVADEAQVAEVARALLWTIMEPIRLGDYDCRTTASIGIALFPDHGGNEHALMRNAEIALYQAKDCGKNAYRVFVDQVDQQPLERLALEAHLLRALEQGELRVFYQPKIDLATGRVGAVEALLRWQHPDLDLVSPSRFIPLAEETGLIVPMGLWVLRSACEQHMRWLRDGLPPIRVAVNLSPRQLQSDRLLRDVDEILRQTGMDAGCLELEITETAVMQDPEGAREQLEALRARGIRLAMDDFGVGHSSMALLKRFPIDTLKIDRSFIRDLATDGDDRAIVAAIIAMGKAVSVRIVAEGVETQEQLDYLQDQRCDEAQGFLFSRPLPVDEMTAAFERLGVTTTRTAETRELVAPAAG